MLYIKVNRENNEDDAVSYDDVFMMYSCWLWIVIAYSQDSDASYYEVVILLQLLWYCNGGVDNRCYDFVMVVLVGWEKSWKDYFCGMYCISKTSFFPSDKMFKNLKFLRNSILSK